MLPFRGGGTKPAATRRGQNLGPAPVTSDAISCMDPPAGEVTKLLNAWCGGDTAALDRLAPVVESELRRLAHVYLSREDAGHTLQPTALINEAYLRPIEWKTVGWQTRAHFYAVAAKMMRRILVSQALARKREKRGGEAILVSLTEADGSPGGSVDYLAALDEALTSLA